MSFKCYADTTYVQVVVAVSDIACSRHLYIYIFFKLPFMLMRNIMGGNIGDA